MFINLKSKIVFRFSHVSILRSIPFSCYLPSPLRTEQFRFVYIALQNFLGYVTQLGSIKRTTKHNRFKMSGPQREPLNSTIRTVSSVFISSRTRNQWPAAGTPTFLMFCLVQSYVCQESYNGVDIHLIAILKITIHHPYVANQTFSALFPLWVRLSCEMRIWII